MLRFLLGIFLVELAHEAIYTLFFYTLRLVDEPNFLVVAFLVFLAVIVSWGEVDRVVAHNSQERDNLQQLENERESKN